MKITIQQHHLKAVSYAMAIKDIRYYLTGIYIETNGAECRLVATDGHRLHAVRWETGEALGGLFSAIMPLAFVKTLLKQKVTRYSGKSFDLEFSGDSVTCQIDGDVSTGAKLIDGVFPDYSRVIPASVSGEVAMYQPEYLVDLNLAAQAYTENNVEIYTIKQGGNGSGAFSIGGFTAVIMPVRGSTGDDAPNPLWKQALRGVDAAPFVDIQFGASPVAVAM